MLQNYLKIAWRNLLKNRTFSLINIAGLAIGLSCFLLIALYVYDELSFDRFHDKAHRIYRVDSDITMGSTEMRLAVASDPLGATLKKDNPQVEEFVRFYTSDGAKFIRKGNQFINEPSVAYVDSTFFSVFSFPAIKGDVSKALNEPNTVVLTEKAARKYFGTTDVLGKMVESTEQGNHLYKVTAVIEDMPVASHFHFDLLFSMDNVDYGFGNYLSHNFSTYLLLREGSDPRAFDKIFRDYLKRYVIPQARQFMNLNSIEEFEKSGNKLQYTLQPLLDIHLHSDRFPELSPNGDIQYVYIFSAVAIFILLIACINFMNLSTARSANRAREVGIRKVLGTERKSLIGQFLTESILMVFIALVLALLIAILVLPYFNDLSAKSLSIGSLLSWKTVPLLLLLPLVVGTIAGSYPAFFLSSFQPIKVLKGKVSTGFKKSSLRSSLVVFQFATTIILIIGTIIVYNQLNFIQTTKIGFNKDQVLVVNGTSLLGDNAETFKNEVKKMTGVVNGSYSGFLPVASSSRTDNSFSTSPQMDSRNAFNMQAWSVDYDYLATIGMELAKGRNFSRDFGTDSTALIINEAAAKLLGFKDPIGQKLYANFDNTTSQTSQLTIIGVVKDFHYESLHRTVAPLSMRLGNSNWATAFKINAAIAAPLLKNIEARWKSMAPEMPFRYEFLDESFGQMYRTEQRAGSIAMSFAILTIFIAGLGLFGLATYIAEQRTREIGVRKVLGATVNNLVRMLSWDFVKLVAIAALVAFPIAWYCMHRWLQDFAYRTPIAWWVFAVAAIAALVLALVTVSFQAIRVSLANPVKSLRTE